MTSFIHHQYATQVINTSFIHHRYATQVFENSTGLREMTFARNLGLQTQLFDEEDPKTVKYCFGKICLDSNGHLDRKPEYLYYPYLSGMTAVPQAKQSCRCYIIFYPQLILDTTTDRGTLKIWVWSSVARRPWRNFSPFCAPRMSIIVSSGSEQQSLHSTAASSGQSMAKCPSSVW